MAIGNVDGDPALEIVTAIGLDALHGTSLERQQLALLERFEKKLNEYPDNTRRAVIELAKDWRTDRVLRRLEAMLAVVDSQTSLIVSGAGDVIEPTDGIIGIGSGGPFAASAAKALLQHSKLGAKSIVESALKIAGELCIYTNTNIRVETL